MNKRDRYSKTNSFYEDFFQKQIEYFQQKGYKRADIIHSLNTKHFKAFYWYLKRRGK